MEQQKKSYYNCSVDGCLNSTLNSEFSFFRLPVVSERRTEWLRLIHREDLIDSSCFRARVCEVHFSPDCIIINSSRKLLKRNAIPQRLLPLPNNFANKGIQAIIETVDANVQCDYDLQTNAQVHIALHLSKDTPRKRKLSEVQRCGRRLKITQNTQAEANTFFKLCDKFLTPTLARVVKQQTKIKTKHGNRKKQLAAAGPSSLAVLCRRVIRKYKIKVENKKFTPPETFSVVGGKPLRKRPEKPPPETEVKKQKKEKTRKNPPTLAALCQIVLEEYNLLPQCEETELPSTSQLLIESNPYSRNRKKPLKSYAATEKNKQKRPKGRPRKDRPTSEEYDEPQINYSNFLEQSQDIRKIKVEQDLFLEHSSEVDPLQEEEEEGFTVVIKEEQFEAEEEEITQKVPVTVEVPRATAQGMVINPTAKIEIPGPSGSMVVPRTMTVIMDEYQLFANSIAEQLRALPPNRALLLQFDIQSMIDNEKQLIGHES